VKSDLYDALTHEYLTKDAGEEGCFTIPPKSSRLLVVLPAGSHITEQNKNEVVDSTIVSYHVSNFQ